MRHVRYTIFMQQLTYTLEVAYLKTLQALLIADEITVDGAHESAQVFLDMLPFESLEDAEEKIEQYCEQFPVFSLLRVEVGRQVEQVETNEVIERMRACLKSGDIDAALAAAKESYD